MRHTGIQITWSPQVTPWQVLNGDDVAIEKNLILASSAIRPPEGPEDYLDSCSWVPSSSDKSLVKYTDLNLGGIIRKSCSLSLVSTCIHPILSLKFLSFFCVCSPLPPLVSFCFFVLLVSASYPHFYSESFLSSSLESQHNEIKKK